MAQYTQYSQAWLEDPTSILTVLVEAQVLINNVLTNVYFSTDAYTSADGSVTFLPLISKSITSTESITIDNNSSMVISDLELANHNGALDTYLDNTIYIWSNQPIAMYLGDPQWNCTNITDIRGTALGALTGGKFSLIFNGIIDDIDSRSRNSVNIKFRDKLERLNTPLTEEKLGTYGVWAGGQQNQDQIKPIIFGEVFNVTPMLVDPSRLKYQFNTGASAGLIEVRDTGMPLLPLNEVLNLVATVTATPSTSGGVTSATGPATTSTVTTGGSGWITGDQVYVVDSSNTPVICQNSSALAGDTSISINTVFSGYISIGMQLEGSGIPSTTTLIITGQTAGTPGLQGTYTISPVLPANIVSSTTLKGTNVPSVFLVTASAGVVSSLTLVTGGSGIISGSKIMGLFSNSVSRTATTVDNNRGILILGLQASGAVTCSAQGTNKSLNLTTGILTSSYSNSIAQNIGLIVTQYGKTTTRLLSTDIDLVNFQSISTTPIGIAVVDNTNVLNIVKQLTSSINSQVVFTRTGLLKILRYGVGYNTDRTITNIYEADMVYGTLIISRRLPIIGVVKIGYAKNYTVQAGLVVNIPQSHKVSFAEEYLNTTNLNQSVILAYKLSNDSNQINTQLITEQSADAESVARLSYYSTQRTVYKFTGTRKLLSLVLGQSVTLGHSRFGLFGGGAGGTNKLGQVVTLSPNWSTGLIEVEVLI